MNYKVLDMDEYSAGRRISIIKNLLENGGDHVEIHDAKKENKDLEEFFKFLKDKTLKELTVFADIGCRMKKMRGNYFWFSAGFRRYIFTVEDDLCVIIDTWDRRDGDDMECMERVVHTSKSRYKKYLNDKN